MSNAVGAVPDDRCSLACALASDLLFAVGFGVLTVVSALSVPALPSPLQPGIVLGLGLVIGGGLCRILAGESLPAVRGVR
jgi:hypothetical protein